MAGIKLEKGPDGFYYFVPKDKFKGPGCSKECSGRYPGFRLAQVKTEAIKNFIGKCEYDRLDVVVLSLTL